jgi:hypothetical protein|nr:MAG TPA: hypothetical protein [Caudoviricetes sp.]
MKEKNVKSTVKKLNQDEKQQLLQLLDNKSKN